MEHYKCARLYPNTLTQSQHYIPQPTVVLLCCIITDIKSITIKVLKYCCTVV